MDLAGLNKRGPAGLPRLVDCTGRPGGLGTGFELLGQGWLPWESPATWHFTVRPHFITELNVTRPARRPLTRSIPAGSRRSAERALAEYFRGAATKIEIWEVVPPPGLRRHSA